VVNYLQGFAYDGLDRLTALQEFGATTVVAGKVMTRSSPERETGQNDRSTRIMSQNDEHWDP
jgi:hypothetical protein